MRALLSVAAGLLLAASLAGCLDGPGAAPGDGADEAGGDLDRTTETRTFERTTSEAGSADHALEVDGDVVRFTAALEIQGADGDLTVRTPEGTAVASGSNVTVHGNHLERGGTGDWELDVRADPLDDAASYEVQVHLVVGPRRPAADLPAHEPPPPEDAGAVVALVDSGVNVYHEVFHRTATDPPARDAARNRPARSVPLTHEGSRDERLAGDDPAWRSLERRALYRFEGTNLYGISFVPDDHAPDFYPVLDESGHGTATAHAVLMNAPRATLVEVEVSGNGFREIAEAIGWTARQDWIDVVSVSLGNVGNVPWFALLADSDLGNAVAEASRDVVRSGKLYVNSAGNDPSPHYADNTDGPPWVVSVSGAEPATRGRDLLPSNGPDVVSNFTVDAATHASTNGTAWSQGTSYSAPSAAGSFARAVRELREATGTAPSADGGPLVDADRVTVTNHDLREAFNRSAVYWDTADYDPTHPPGNDTETRVAAASAPVLPAPWVQTGWGYVDGRVADDAARHLLGEAEQEAKPAPARAHMQAQQELRRRYWRAQLGPR